MLLSLSIVLIAALLMGRLAARLGQAAVLGELLAGVVLGAVPQLEPLKTEPALETLSELGVLVLLFQVGLESSVGKMWSVGAPALRVAVVGVLLPMAFGYGVALWLAPSQAPFLAATLAATSVGITARVLKDLRRTDAPEARVILGAAVIDDVLGLIVLALVAGSGGAVGLVFKAFGFLVGAVLFGLTIARPVATNPVTALAFCFALSWLAGAVGLSPIVGAFAAGLVIQDEPLERAVAPIGALLVPFFFVRMGLKVNLAAAGSALPLALALTAAAVLGKLLSGWAARRRVDALTVGIGMIPRGEVGLIFASLGVLDETRYAAVVVMVLITTLVTPPLLKWRLDSVERLDSKRAHG
jgi:Kef-type K+ transport system membrane component KefB